MGFQHSNYEIQKAQIQATLDDKLKIRPSIGPDEDDYDITDSFDEGVRKNSVGEKLNSMIESLRLFFTSVSVRPRASSSSMSYTTQLSCETSSGYQSMDASWELGDSYIKVAKFTENIDETEHGHYGTYKEYKEMAMQQSLASQIKDVVETNTVVGNIKISDYLTLRTSGDVMNLSKSEPYGLKGCKLILLIEDNGVSSHLGNIFPEKGLICTFEVTLVLHVKKNVCRKLPFFNCKQIMLNVLEQYELRKEKMYKRKSVQQS